MNPSPAENIYLPKVAVVEGLNDEIPDVKTVHWSLVNPEDQKAFISAFKPGQFCLVTIPGKGEFTLSLPPSPTEGKTFFTLRKVGVCSTAFQQYKPGDKFALRGPFGNGFPMESYHGKNIVVVAGGIGLIPLRSTIVYILGNRDKFKDLQIYYGAKNPETLMYADDLKKWEKGGAQFHLTVDGASPGYTGNIGVVGSLFKKYKPNVENTVAFVCGPPIMFRFVIKDLLDLGFKESSIVSTMERYMKCGVGKCGHCCVGVSYVCVDGPVFTYEQLKRLGEVI
jgi:NAD(P)H-flavin reductase